jgi:hypothetical protein
VKAVVEMGWRALTNGALMKEAGPDFDVLVALDQNLPFQNQTGKCLLGIVILITESNDLAAYRPRFAEIRDLVRQTKPGEVNVLQLQQLIDPCRLRRRHSR